MNNLFVRKMRGIAMGVLLVVSGSALADSGYVVRSCKFMEKPFRDASVISTLDKGTTIDILKRKGGWMNISVGDQAGWVRMSYVRKGEGAGKAEASAEAGGVLALASGRAGTGNVVASTGVRGLSEEDLKSAKYSATLPPWLCVITLR